MIAVVFLIISNLEISNLMICEKNINLTGAGVSTAEGAFQEVGQIYAANRSTVLGLKLSFTFDSISISNVWPRVLKSSPDNKTAVFAFTDPPTGRILDSAAWVSVPLMAG